jgi:hypothetical protein
MPNSLWATICALSEPEIIATSPASGRIERNPAQSV